MDKKPNVVLIVIDTLRADHTAIGDYNKNITPYLKDHLMRDGISFMNTFSNSPWTLPSIASLMTSLYPSKINIINLLSKLDEEYITLAEILKERGYHTCGIISHLLLDKKYGLAQGFDIYNDRNISDQYGNHYSISSPGVTEDAIKFIKKNKKRKFFLFLHYFDPHYIYLDHEKRMPYSGDFTSRDIKKLRDLIRINKYTKEDIDYLKYCYDTEIKFTDNYIGKVIEELKMNGIYNNTLVIFTSDHGEEFVEKGWLGHSTTVYNEQIRIPLLFKLHSKEKKLKIKVNTSLVSNIDVFPTILSLIKIKNPQKTQGKDIFSSKKKNRVVFSEIKQDQFGGKLVDRVCVISGDWKLIKDFTEKKYELYNLKLDPKELEDVSKVEKSICSGLKMKLVKWIRFNRYKKEAKKRKPLTQEEKKRLKTLGYI